jgi:hypothetical protein
MKPLVILDTSVVTHHVINLTRDKSGQVINKLNNADRDERLRRGYALYNSLFWFVGANAEDFDILWVGDSKEEKYWRTKAVRDWLDSLDPEDPILVKRKGTRLGYKGNRNTCTYAQWVHKRMMQFVKPLAIPSYEADDIAAAIIKLEKERPIILCTVDSDWLQMVDERVSWCCLTGFNPAFRDVNAAQQWFNAKMEKESKKNQPQIDTNDLRQIVKWKSLVGDKSDNLPAGTPEEFIDLFNPPEDYKLWQSAHFKMTYKKYIQQGTQPEGDIWMDWVVDYGMPTTSDVVLPERLLANKDSWYRSLPLPV